MKKYIFIAIVCVLLGTAANAQQGLHTGNRNASSVADNYKGVVVNPQDFVEVDAMANIYMPRNQVYSYNEAIKVRKELEAKIQNEPNSIGLRWALLRFYVSGSNFVGGSSVKAIEQARQIYGESRYIGCLAYEFIYARMRRIDRAELWYRKSLYLAQNNGQMEWKEIAYNKPVQSNIKVTGPINNWEQSYMYEKNDGNYARKILKPKSRSNEYKVLLDDHKLVDRVEIN